MSWNPDAPTFPAIPTFPRRRTPGDGRSPLERLLEPLYEEARRRQQEAEEAERKRVEEEQATELARQRDELERLARELERQQEDPTREPPTPTPSSTTKGKAAEIFEALGSLFGGTGPQPQRGTATPGQIRTQALRGQPMSILGRIGQGLGAVANVASIYNTVRQAGAAASFPAMSFTPSSAILSPLPRVGPGGFTTGGFMGGGARTARGGFRKRRRTNPTNVHALRRALRRVEGFVRIEKRVDKIVNRLGRHRRTANRSGFIKRR